MVSATFPFNPVLVSMEYDNVEKLTLEFRKKTGTQKRTYTGVPKIVAYTLFYKKTGTDVLMYFAKYIKKQYKVTEVK